ncbi:MAG: hypothetical protein ACHQ4J_14425 [Candidatus Binatia bacterium]
MPTPLTHRHIGALILLLGITVCTGASAQTPTPTPTGEFLCSAGPQDGQPCNSDADCAPTGVCVIAPGICNGGTSDGAYCDCAAGTCVASTPVCDPTFTGVCQGGPTANQCCDATTNCAGGVPCVGTQKVCLAGSGKGSSCLNDNQCPGSSCQSTGKFCSGGDFDSYSCVDDADCNNVNGSPGGSCLSAGQPIPTPTPTPTPAACTGDCDGSGDVTVNEIIILVNMALGSQTQLSACPNGLPAGITDPSQVNITMIISAVNNALNGCGSTIPTPAASGEFLCSAGPRDGQACNADSDCAPGGACVIAQGVCEGGADDASYCGCIAGTCSPSTPACDPTITGVCVGGANAALCCSETSDPLSSYVPNCSGGAPCVGTGKVCLGGSNKGVSCLNDTICVGSVCQSTGEYCNGGDFDGYSCVDSADCLNVDGSSVGTCQRPPAAMLTQLPADTGNACVITDQCPA